MDAGEIYLANFPFGELPGMKLRPVLSLTGAVGPVPEILVAYISSVIPKNPLPTDLLLNPSQAEHRSANLKSISVVRLHKLATIHTSCLARKLGALQPTLRAEVSAKLKLLLNL